MRDLTPGQSIAQRFTLIRRLEPEPGCTVWLADDEARGAPATLRFPDKQLHAAELQEARRELRRISHLVHPNVIPCLGLFQHEELSACAHVYIEGGDLRDWSGRDYREVLKALLPVMDALGYLHDLGVAHGGLNARAVRISDDGGAFLEGTGVAVLTARGGEAPDIRGDLRAFGKLLSGLAGVETGTPLPDALTELFSALQAAEGGAPNIHAARRQIRRTLQLEDESGREAVPADGASAGPVAARTRTASIGAVSGKRPESRTSVPMLIAAPALLAILTLAILVIFYLPQSVSQAPVGADGGTPNSTPVRTSGKPITEPLAAPFAAAESARVRQDAQDAAMSLMRSLVALEERHAEAWAAEDFSAARLAGEEGDAIYLEQQFSAALARYREGLALAESLVGRSGEVLSMALENGESALQAGDAGLARQQFELAALIDSEHPDAQSGLRRASALTEVVGLLAVGAEQEQAGRFAEARDTYRQAVTIDPQFGPAKEALQRAGGKLASHRYQQVMSRGFAELNKENIPGARAAFEEAARMRPDAAGPKDALAQLGLRLRNNEIGDRRAAAVAAEREEQWRRAEAEYQAALDADNTLVFARDGLARAGQRAQLDERMALLISEPLRMFSNDVYNEARAMLAQARFIDDRGPRLREQITLLAERIELARQPVAVQLRSDGQTTVTIFKVGELGRFQERTVGLIPGRYTAVGARAGYRDVRREFVVQAGAAATQLMIVCEDPV